MNDFLPNTLNLPSQVREWMTRLSNWAKRNELKSSSDILVSQTTYGTTLTVSDRIKQKWSQPGTTTTATSGLNWNWRGSFTLSPPAPYMTFDVVQTTSGGWLSTIDNNPDLPDSGIGWTQVVNGQGVYV